MRQPAQLLTAFLCVLATPGCTKAVVEYAGEVEVRENRVAAIGRAWRAGDAAMVICATGWPAARSRTTPPVEFHVSVPLALFENRDQPAPLLLQDHGRRIRTIVVPATRIGAGCPKNTEGASDIRTIAVEADYFASVSPRQAADEQIERFADPHATNVALFGFETPSQPPDVALLYRHDDPVFEGSRLVWIDPGNASFKPHEIAYLAVPLAFAADVVMVVGIIFVFAVAAAAGA